MSGTLTSREIMGDVLLYTPTCSPKGLQLCTQRAAVHAE